MSTERQGGYWRESTNNSKILFANYEDFINDGMLNEDIRMSYEDYTKHTDPNTLELNAKGYPKFNWEEEDQTNKCKYVPTWSLKYKWGIMRTPLEDKTKDKDKSKTGTLPTSEHELPSGGTSAKGMLDILNEMLAELKQIKNLLDPLEP